MKPGGSRAKGAAGEKEVMDILSEHLGLKLVRNPHQTARGGRDIIEDVDQKQLPIPWSIEIKRQEKENLGPWWKQCLEQAEGSRRIPVLFWRANRQPWRVATDPHHINPATWPAATGRMVVMDLETGLQWMREGMQ